MTAAIPTINKSSIIVTVLIGRLKTVPKQAHLISDLFSTDRITPMLLKPIIIIVAEYVKIGLKEVKYAIPSPNSMKG